MAMKGDGLKECHRIDVLSAVLTQKDQARDLRLILTDRVEAKFLINNVVETPTGHWCKICK